MIQEKKPENKSTYNKYVLTKEEIEEAKLKIYEQMNYRKEV